MNVLLINGSPHENGCTYTALREIEERLHTHDIETELFFIGHKPIRGCTGCKLCKDLKRCVYQEDSVNAALEKARDADAFIFGSPVHYAGACGGITSFLDRLFYAATPDVFSYKPGAAIVTLRRGGATAAFEQLNKYFTISNMPIVSSAYWNMVHGNTPEEVTQDLEGMFVMRTLADNMAWLLKSIHTAEKNGVKKPVLEERIRTNFIR